MTGITNTARTYTGPRWPNSDPRAIEQMEAEGQAEVVASDLLPTEIFHNDQSEFEALGFTFGDPVEDDPLFRPATLPAGWTRRASGHPMWSAIVDEDGVERVEVFYKAAFYDRQAHMSLVAGR